MKPGWYRMKDAPPRRPSDREGKETGLHLRNYIGENPWSAQ